MANIFTKVLQPKVRSSNFNLSHDVKMSFNMGELVPSMIFDVLPGDRFKINSESMLRFAPLISPVMHEIKVITNYFFCPNRLLWDGWEDFITGTNTNDPPPTAISIADIAPGGLGDYLGYPTDASNAGLGTFAYSALPFAAYLKIYDEWYRDQNLQPAIFVPLTSGQNNAYNGSQIPSDDPQLRAKMHDYFTSALPFAQKGDAVVVPLGDVTLKADFEQNRQILRDAAGAGLPNETIGSDSSSGLETDPGGTGVPAWIDPNGTLETESSTIETLRKAFRLQEFLEKNARGGTRYTEHMKAHFNVNSQDYRLQRPEYIGGTVGNMIISEVLNTTGDPNGQQGAAVGDMAGHGISVNQGKTFKYTAREHGWILGIISVTPKTAYQQGLPRMFRRPVYTDYAFPSFANLGEQEIYNWEIFMGTNSPDIIEDTFGYIPRYAEYKYVNSRVAGDFKTTLAFWHLGLIYNNPPALNAEFLKTNPQDYDRIFAVTDPDVDKIYAHIYNNVTVNRRLPKYGIPQI